MSFTCSFSWVPTLVAVTFPFILFQSMVVSYCDAPIYSRLFVFCNAIRISQTCQELFEGAQIDERGIVRLREIHRCVALRFL